jgi:hypothetical protein
MELEDTNNKLLDQLRSLVSKIGTGRGGTRKGGKKIKLLKKIKP